MFSKKKNFIIAEIANSHEGDFKKLIETIEVCKKVNADAVKFQIIIANELATSKHKNFKLYKKLQFSTTEWTQASKLSKKLGLKVFADVFGLKSTKIAEQIKVDGFKIHTSEMGNKKLFDFMSKSKKPILVSTAGSKISEIQNVVTSLSKTNEIILLHGFQGYPTKINELNLKRIKELKDEFGLPTGIMDHVSGESNFAEIIPLIATSLGAKIIEKHITLDRSKKKLDYYSSLNPEQFSNMVKMIRTCSSAFGDGSTRIIGNELKYRRSHKKTLISKRAIKKGEKLKDEFFDYKRIENAKSFVSYFDIENKVASRNIAKSKPISYEHIQSKMPKVVAIIACRIHSDRLFAKPLQKISNETILKRIISQIRKSTLVKEIILAISENEGNQVFEKFAKENDLRFVKGNETDVLSRLIKGAHYTNADIVFRCTSENPFLYWEKIDDVISNHVNGKYNYTFIAKLPLGTGFELINTKSLEISHKQGTRKHRSELCTLYINENKKKFKIQVYNPEKKLQKPGIRLTVDTPEDLQFVRKIVDKIGSKNYTKLIDVISVLEKYPELNNLNKDVKIEYRRFDNE